MSQNYSCAVSKEKKEFKSTPQSLIIFDSLPDAAFVRVGTVAGLLDCSVVTVWRRAKDGTIPKSKKISARVTGWNVGELRAALKEIHLLKQSSAISPIIKNLSKDTLFEPQDAACVDVSHIHGVEV